MLRRYFFMSALAASVAQAATPTLEQQFTQNVRPFVEKYCTACHSGPHLTNNATIDVGTGDAFQVPTLIGVGLRAPYLHDGCAASLADRFGPCGGGDSHGTTSQLSSSDIGDLITYLQSL